MVSEKFQQIHTLTPTPTPVANEIILVVVLQKSSKCWPGTSQQVSSAFGLHYLHHPTRSQQSGQSVTLCDISSDMYWGYVAARLPIWSWNCGRWHGYEQWQKRTYVQCLTLQRTKHAHQIQWPHSTHATWPNHQVIAYQCPRLACTCMYACKVGLTEMCHNQSVLWLSTQCWWRCNPLPFTHTSYLLGHTTINLANWQWVWTMQEWVGYPLLELSIGPSVYPDACK